MLFNLSWFLLVIFHSFNFIFPIGIFEVNMLNEVKSMIILSILIGIFIYEFKDFKKVLIGSYRWIVKKNRCQYKEISHLFVMLIVFATHLFEFCLMGIVHFKLPLLSLLVVSLLNIIDADKDVEDFGKKEYLIFFIMIFLGVMLKISGVFILLFSKITKLNSEESYKIYSYNLVSMLFFGLIGESIIIDNSYLWILMAGVLLGYIMIFLFHYLHSLNKLKTIARLSLICYLCLLFFY